MCRLFLLPPNVFPIFFQNRLVLKLPPRLVLEILSNAIEFFANKICHQ